MAQPPQKPNGPKLGANGKPLAGLDSSEPELGKTVHKTDELANTCQHLEEQLEELKVKYEMYFLGVERLEPAKWRAELKKDIARLKTAFTRNTGLRFRIASLHARYLSYERMWLRNAREKEEGTYRRDLFKARLRVAPATPPEAAKKKALGAPEDVDLSDWAVQVTPSPMRDPIATAKAAGASAKAPTAAAKGAPARSPAPPGGLDDRQMKALYEAYVTAKKRCNEDTSRLTYDAVAKTVSKQIPELMTRYKAKAVDFKVVIKDGKAVLKAVPKT